MTPGPGGQNGEQGELVAQEPSQAKQPACLTPAAAAQQRRSCAELPCRTLSDLLSLAASRFQEKTALQVCRGGQWRRLTYRELLARASMWGRALAAAGLSPGDRALLVSEGAPEWGVGYFAILSQGAVVVPLDPQLSAADMAAIAAMTGARLWLLSPAVLNRISDVVDQTPGSPVIFDIGSFANPPDGSRLAAEGQEDLAPERPDGSGGQPSELTASIPFTSGTTLAPKGVPLTHRNFLSDLQAVLKVMPVNPRDQFLSVLPMHHVLEFTGGFLAPLSRGATITYVERLTPKAILEAMQVTGTTVIIAVPRLCALLVRAIQAGAGSSRPWMQKASASLASLARSSQTLAKAVPLLEPGLRRLRALLCRAAHRLLGGRMRLIVSGGAALPPEIFDALDLMGFTVCEGYGLTETSPVLTFNPPERPRCGTVGRPLPGVELRIEQPDAEGVGTVLVKGPCVFSGYLGDEQATREAFCGEWFRTSDLGRLDRHGYLVLAGRADDVIVTGGGKNVYPVEIEWLYQGLPHVKEFCVVGVPDPATAGDAVHAVIVEDDNEGSPPAEVRRPEIESAVSEISRRVTTHQRIRAIHFWDGDLPRTPTLKVKRKQIQQALRELLAARQRRPMGPGS